eukprot:NP_001024677.1 Uncharacterized protein CELE_F46H5.7 [Caenorhabditis elegans]
MADVATKIPDASRFTTDVDITRCREYHFQQIFCFRLGASRN